MKLYLTYGVGISLAGMLIILIEFFLGYHSDLEKFGTGQIIGSVGGITVSIVGLVMGIRARRESTPDGSLTYGQGVGAGAMIGVFSGLAGAVMLYVYGAIINPQFHDLLFDYQIQQAVAKGASREQLEGAEGIMRFFTSATWMALVNLIAAPIMSTVISLIVAAFLKRAPTAQPPAVPSA